MSKHFNTSPVFQAPLFFLILCFINSAVVADPRATEAALICTNETALISQSQSFISSFLAALGTLTTLISRQKYAAAVNGTGQNTTVYAFGECLRDLSTSDCDLCFAQCKTQILRCLPFQKATLGGRLFYDGCYIRYDRFSFFNESLSDEDRSVCGAARFRGNSTLFETNVGELVRRLRVEAVRKDGFFVANVSRGNVTVYGLAQCWEPVRGSGCVRCLSDAADRVRDCDGKEEGRVLNAGCYLRYSMHKFYNNDTVADGGGRNGGRSRLAMILAVTFAAFAVVFAVSAFGVLRRRKLVKKRKEKKQLGSLLSVVNKSQLNYSYEVLETSTNYFHDSNKLGQGGSGSVYKGVLPNGKVVAIKRLFFNTRQWVDHFFNEVNLISGIHHKNLVGLLGCSITGPESLLVYEYVPNQSLHDYFSARNNLERLRWELRSKIILGTAEGLAYLHEESKVRIIHRDIKLSNILLDEDFMPKIADFGLARLFPEDKTHISTAIAGTLGYMAPEYVTRGKLTEKADVFSFGVLLIEVISGKRINSFASNSVSILQTVWDLYGSDQLCNAVDPVLEGNFINSEASHLLRVGLLCVQASAELRPSMSSVVKMLTDQNIELPQPTQPPFLNSGSAEYRKHIPSGTSSSRPESHSHSSGNSLTQSWIEPR